MDYEYLLSMWMENAVKPTVKIQTYRKYARLLQHHILPWLGKKKLSELTPTRLQEHITLLYSRKLSASTIHSVITILKQSLRYGVRFSYLEEDPSKDLLRPRLVEKRVECFTRQEQKKIEDYVLSKEDPKLFGIVLTLYTGLRIGELLALEWKDIDWENGLLQVDKSCYDSWSEGTYRKVIDTPKTSSSIRIIPLPQPILKKLKNYRDKALGTRIVSSASGKEAEVRSYQRTFARILKRLGIPHRGFHSLRHTFATRALECGMDVKTLSEILGHRNADVTLRRYTHSLLNHKRDMMKKGGRSAQEDDGRISHME